MKSGFYIFTVIFLLALCPDLSAAAEMKKTSTKKNQLRKKFGPLEKQEKSEAITSVKKEVLELYRVHDQLRNSLLQETSKLQDKEQLQDIQNFLQSLQTILAKSLSDKVNENAMEKLKAEKEVLKTLNAELFWEIHRILELEQIASGRVAKRKN
jgi:hypothetical protein